MENADITKRKEDYQVKKGRDHMKKMKKWLLCFLCVGVLCGTAACGNREEQDVTPENQTEQKQDPDTVGGAVKDGVDDVGDAIDDGVHDVTDGVDDIADDLTGNEDRNPNRDNDATDSSNTTK